MGTDILLVNPPWTNREGHIYSKVGASMPPLGLAQIASVLRGSGFSVDLVDACLLNSQRDFEKKLIEKNPKIVGVSATTSTITSAEKIIPTITSLLPSAKVVLGGVHPSIFPEETASIPGVDCVVKGEGEKTAIELAHALLSDGDISKIQGITFKSNGGISSTPWREPIADLDSLPTPAYDLLDLKAYHPAYGTYKRLPAISMITSRGCPGVCTFCYKRMFGTRIRAHSPERIIQNIEALTSKHGVREIIFYDDTFTVLRDNVLKICRGIKERGLDITWSCMARVDYVDPKLLDAMASAGCHSIGFGVESADEQILKNICKMISLDKAKEAVKNTQDAGIEARAFFMLGNPGETLETMDKTIDFAVELDPDIALFNITTPFPGTAMYTWAENNGYLTTKDWNRYDCSEPIMDLPTVSRESILSYYKKAYRKFYLRPSYILKRISMIRSLEDISVGFNTLRGIIGH